MAKLLKRTNLSKASANHIRANQAKYKSVYEYVKDLFDRPNESIFMLTFNSDDVCVGIQDVSLGGGTSSSVAHDIVKMEAIWKSIDGTGLKWGLCHNHPYMEDKDGNWMETLVSDGDVYVTKSARQACFMQFEDLEYVGHFIVNKEDDDRRKIIDMENMFKFSQEVLDVIKDGGL